MSQKNQGNRQSESGMSRAKPGAGGKSVKEDMYCGASDKHGIRFPVPNHHGLADNEGRGAASPEK